MTGKRSFQFGLRKLLLWTAVVALYLGVFGMLAPILDGWVLLLSLVIVVGMIRAVSSAITAAVLSVTASGIVLLDALSAECGLLEVAHPFNLLLVFGGACYWGVLLFAVVELPFRIVDWIDNLMRTKADRRG